MKRYEIKIRWNGKEFHSSMQEQEGDQFRFMPDTVWPEWCAKINTDALATIATQTQEIADISATLEAIRVEYAAFKASATRAAESALSIINNPDVNAEQTVLAVGGIAAEMLKNKLERDLDAANKVIAEAIEARDKLLKGSL